MQKKQVTYSQVRQCFYSLLMMALLLWLTVSTPYVYKAQQEVAAAQGIVDDDTSNPLSNTNEERVENGASTISEYLHEPHHYVLPYSLVASLYKCHPDDLYSAFHPELLSPPPESRV